MQRNLPKFRMCNTEEYQTEIIEYVHLSPAIQHQSLYSVYKGGVRSVKIEIYVSDKTASARLLVFTMGKWTPVWSQLSSNIRTAAFAHLGKDAWERRRRRIDAAIEADVGDLIDLYHTIANGEYDA